MNRFKKSKKDGVTLNPPSLHLFTDVNSNQGPYFDIEFLENYKHIVQERACTIIDLISPSKE